MENAARAVTREAVLAAALVASVMWAALPGCCPVGDVPTADNLLLEDSPGTNFRDSHINIGANATGRDRGLLAFDVSEFADSSLQSATLRLWVEDGPCRFSWDSTDCGYQLVIEVHEILDPWDPSSVTWDTQPDFDLSAASSTSVSSDQSWVDLDVTDVVQGWLEDDARNNGLLLKSDSAGEETGGSSISIYMGTLEYPSPARPATLELE